MAEMPNTCENHRQTVFIRGGDNFFVAHRPARLNNRTYTCLCRSVYAVPERKMHLTPSLHPAHLTPLLPLSILQFGADDPTHLACTNADGLRIPRMLNRIRFSEPRNLP